MDVLFNSMAVTFLYNLDDIGGEMGHSPEAFFATHVC